MGRFVARQPNGRLCIFSTVVDTVVYYDLTDEDYIELKAEEAREDARYDLSLPRFVKPFSDVIKYFAPNNMTQEEFNSLCKEMEEKK